MRTRVREGIRRYHPLEAMRFVAHLPNFIRLFLRLLADRRVSLFAKGLLLSAFAYVLSPVDFIPDLALLLGQMDDLAILALACRLFIRACPQGVVREHVARIDESGRWSPVRED